VIVWRQWRGKKKSLTREEAVQESTQITPRFRVTVQVFYDWFQLAIGRFFLVVNFSNTLQTSKYSI
jgi:hypothetical protein